MTCHLQINHNLRQTGRTQKMIDLIIESIVDGQPICRVIGINYRHIDSELMPRILKALSKKGTNVKRLSKYLYDCDGVKLAFHIVRDIEQGYLIGAEHHDCQFWDHAAMGEL